MPIDWVYLTDQQKEEEKKVQDLCKKFVDACESIKF